MISGPIESKVKFVFLMAAVILLMLETIVVIRRQQQITVQRSELKTKASIIERQKIVIAELRSQNMALKKETAELRCQRVTLKKEIAALHRSHVPRSSIQMVDDIPTISMLKMCRNMAEAWMVALPLITKLGKD